MDNILIKFEIIIRQLSNIQISYQILRNLRFEKLQNITGFLIKFFMIWHILLEKVVKLIIPVKFEEAGVKVKCTLH